MRFLWNTAFVFAAAFPVSLVAQDANGVTPSSAGYTVDFNDQDVRVVLSALAEAAGVNVTFSNLPEVRTTLHLGKPVPKEQLLDVMRSVAETNGLAMSTEGPLIRISQARRSDEASLAAATPEPRPSVELYTYRLKHASAAQVAPLLMNLFTGTSLDVGTAANQNTGASRADGGNGPQEVVFPVNPVPGGNGGSGGATPNSSGGASAQTSYCLVNNQPQPCDQAFKSFPQLQEQLNNFLQNQNQDNNAQGGRRGGRFNRAAPEVSQVRVVAEESTNTLLIRATPQEWEWIQKILKDIDLRPLQVLIEAVIVEVTRTRDLNVGVDATAKVNRSNGRTIRNGSADLPSTPNARDFLLQIAGGRGAVDFTAALNALASRGDLRVRSLPVIVGQNNKQATLNVGSSRPYVQTSQVVPGTQPFQTTNYMDVGTKLQITPRINPDGYVNLEVSQTANSATNEIQFDAPVINRREATTQVFLRDGQTTVIGGLADNTRDHSSSGIPVLRSLPVVGGLFGSTHNNDVETELYVFLTPHIISDDTDIDRLRDSLQQHSKELRSEPVKPIFPSRPASAPPTPAPAPAPPTP